MKLCRYGRNGFEKPGVIDAQGQLRDLSGVIPNIDQDTISSKGLTKLRKIRPESLPLVRGNPRFGVPYTGISKFVAIGLNYVDHAHEAGLQIPAEPVVFMKATTCISGPNDDIQQPRSSTKLDYEVEIAIVIGTRAEYVSEDEALEHVAGYTPLRAHGEKIFGEPSKLVLRPALILVLPAAGALLAGLLCMLAPEARGGGGDAMIHAFHHQGGVVRRRVIWIKALASILTLGSGGSGGREGPTMQMAGALGSWVGLTLMNIADQRSDVG